MQRTANDLPLLEHPLQEKTVFTPQALIAAVSSARGLPDTTVPAVCVLEFDGDLTDWLVAERIAKPWPTWACFHTPMFAIEADGHVCGIIPRTIGGPFAVLVAEQLAASGAGLVVGLTSAGRVRADLPIPSIVLATSAIRDEGTSYHYVPARRTIDAPYSVVPYLRRELSQLEIPLVEGLVWTTDAPYRETLRQIELHADQGALAVDMQAASLFGFAAARGMPVAVVAHVSNAINHGGIPFDRGPAVEGYRLLQAICRGGTQYTASAVVASSPSSP